MAASTFGTISMSFTATAGSRYRVRWRHDIHGAADTGEHGPVVALHTPFDHLG